MATAEGGGARAYHDATKLSPSGGDALAVNWTDQPRPYKLYRDLRRISLPRQLAASKMPALAALVGGAPQGSPDLVASPVRALNRSRPGAGSALDLATLSTILHHSGGIVRRLRHRRGMMLFRAAPCTGALYHIELYVVCGTLADLDSGVYHFDVHDFSLGQLRAGDYRGALAEASGGEPNVAAAAAVVVCTSTFWRNAWRYQARTYRHSYWDNGTILANMLTMAHAHGIPASIVTGFVDADVNRLLGVDGEREAALSLVPLGAAATPAAAVSPGTDPISLLTVPVSRGEIEYPLIRSAHASSSLSSPHAVAEWRNRDQSLGPQGETDAQVTSVHTVPLAPDGPAAPAQGSLEPVEVVIARRGSARRFDPGPISMGALSTLLTTATSPVPLDVMGLDILAFSDVYLVAHAVEGLASGTYVMTRDRKALELLRAGNLRDEVGGLAVSHNLARNAAVNIYFLADLDRVGARHGNRGYRVTQLDASIKGGRLYLAAYALGLAATGLTFYDDEVTAFFSPHAEGKDVMFQVALGNPAARPAQDGAVLQFSPVKEV